ncbi:DNA-binding transcriptional regulator, LysR family [Micromonospora rhizosphaerae]|uniref:DNA-binding transcriptional regulator, LysR family n=1 Tax=Micromonospora rhizosphaerae TaxID=568872 RepID=A0A1C6SSI2_9ACTN|nr:LysR family transcriptional regulator [Micromonospora rhizosphaerae]SCL32213.1 DNA-binding transcriptional regulator, LysR family [Micromonospora rhizosphaerae]
MLDVRRLQVLRAVVASGSVSAAARHLGYTPSAVSQQLAVLEREAGVVLLERTGRGVRATDAGRLLSGYAAVISRQVAEAETALADLRAGRTGRVVVRYFATAGARLVAPAVAALRREHPGVRVELGLTGVEDPLPELVDGRVDVVLVVRSGAARPVDGVRFTHLCDDAYDAVLPRTHPLAGRPVLALAELAREPWVGCEPPGPCRDAVLDACAAAGFSPDVVVESEDYTTAQGFVAAGLGVSLVPRIALGSPDPQVVVREVGNPRPVRSIHVAVRDAAPLSPGVRGLVAALRRAAAG